MIAQIRIAVYTLFRMKTGIKKALSASLALLLLSSLVACSSRIGWGVVLWTVKGTSAKAGTIVPIYLKSNITRQYVIGLPDDPKRGAASEKLEIPLWQLEAFSSKSDARKMIAHMAENISLYLIAARDGLPVRETPSNSNTIRRIYRLKENEMVKVLGRVEGEAVYTGSEKLPGDWYSVLTLDGTKGYVFSYAMRIFDESTGEEPQQVAAQSDSKAIADVFSRTWRPAWYSSMLEDDMVDLDYFSLRFGLFSDAINRQIRIELPAISKVFQYSSISQDKDWLIFESTDLRIKREGSASILAAWGPSVGAELPDDMAGWRSGDNFMRFIDVKQDIREAIRAEEARQSASSRDFFSSSVVLGPGRESTGMLAFSSPAAGRLELWPSGMYAWKDTVFLPAGFPPSADDSRPEQKGRVSFGLRLSEGLLKEWQGGFTLYPDSGEMRSDYAYRLDPDKLVLVKILPAEPGLVAGEIDARFGTAILEFPAQ
ncbi:MAG: hypothetical protein CVV53_05650 [Spirochaetae bacterium HGW-Spirochaetae-9]|nr:MAG: hypothetical protein CVV53_05650 [Spirochaetae bacterium HGW-Spirochaetae-9]